MALGIAIIEGLSMVPTYAPGERVIVRYGSSFGVGDVVLIAFHDRIDVKRISKIENGLVTIIGDNEAVSIDSRKYGPVQNSQIVAKVIFRLPKWLVR